MAAGVHEVVNVFDGNKGQIVSEERDARKSTNENGE